MSQAITIFWFRRDLRLHDNAALWSALKSGNPVLPIFIFDKTILDLLPKKDARVEFIHQEIAAMKTVLESKGSSLRLFYGTPNEVFKQLTEEYSISEVWTNRDYEPYAQVRDKAIFELLQEKFRNYFSENYQYLYTDTTAPTGSGIVPIIPESSALVTLKNSLRRTMGLLPQGFQ